MSEPTADATPETDSLIIRMQPGVRIENAELPMILNINEIRSIERSRNALQQECAELHEKVALQQKLTMFNKLEAEKQYERANHAESALAAERAAHEKLKRDLVEAGKELPTEPDTIAFQLLRVTRQGTIVPDVVLAPLTDDVPMGEGDEAWMLVRRNDYDELRQSATAKIASQQLNLDAQAIELKRLDVKIAQQSAANDELETIIRQRLAEIEALRADADRYYKVRSNLGIDFPELPRAVKSVLVQGQWVTQYLCGTELDSLIDAIPEDHRISLQAKQVYAARLRSAPSNEGAGAAIDSARAAAGVDK